MKPKTLADYVKHADKMVTTSIYISEVHEAFVRRENLNLSAIVRDRLDELIKAEMPEKKGVSK